MPRIALFAAFLRGMCVFCPMKTREAIHPWTPYTVMHSEDLAQSPDSIACGLERLGMPYLSFGATHLLHGLVFLPCTTATVGGRVAAGKIKLCLVLGD
jgi:hypothetical protein